MPRLPEGVNWTLCESEPKMVMPKTTLPLDALMKDLDNKPKMYWVKLKIKHYLLKIKDAPVDLFYEVKYSYQRATRGWSDRDIWSIDYRLNTLIPQMLKHLIKVHHGCPGEFFKDENKGNECADWVKVLEEMIEGFEANRKMGEMDWETRAEYRELEKKWKKGSKLFIKYYNSLWD